MKVLHGYRNIKGSLNDPVLAIGIFDGIHLGHKRVIKRVLNSCEHGRDAAILTFDPHPQSILSPAKSPPRIMSIEHRLSLFEKMGLDAVIVIRFTEFLAEMSPEEFVKKVIQGIGSRKIYVGSNFHFGYGKEGNVKTFREIGKKYDVDVNVVPPVKQGNRVISSTWLRRLITDGNLEKAEKLLRRPVSILGTVVGGDKRGRSIGCPTANIDPHQEVIPPKGVYAVEVDVAGKLFNGVLNIGFKPTFYGRKLKKRKEPKIEVHIIGYKGDLYGHHLEIFFVKKLRRERKFRGNEGLIKQIKKDIEIAVNVLGAETGTLK